MIEDDNLSGKNLIFTLKITLELPRKFMFSFTSDYYHKIDRILIGKLGRPKIGPKSSGFPNLDPPNLQILEPPGSWRLQNFQILATGFANLEGPKSGNNWM